MAWQNGKRTVRCYKCYAVGHNRRNCPTLTAEQKAEYKDGDRARKCSYCAEKGHNKASCPKRRIDMGNYVEINARFRQSELDRMCALGLGIGALVTSRDIIGEYTVDINKLHSNHVYMITDVNWSECQEKSSSARIFTGQRIGMTEDSYYERYYFSMPAGESYNWSSAQIVSPVSREKIIESVPADWLTGRSGVERYFQ